MLDGDKFIEDPVSVLQRVETFLDIPSFFTWRHFTFNGTESDHPHIGLFEPHLPSLHPVPTLKKLLPILNGLIY